VFRFPQKLTPLQNHHDLLQVRDLEPQRAVHYFEAFEVAKALILEVFKKSIKKMETHPKNRGGGASNFYQGLFQVTKASSSWMMVRKSLLIG